MVSSRIFFHILFALSLGFFSACSDSSDPTTPANETPTETGEILLDEGYVGLIVDTREIFKSGYRPFKVEVTVPGFAQLDTVLVIDQTTNLAILHIHSTELSDEELEQLDQGVPVNFRVLNESDEELASHNEQGLVVDDSNLPVNVHTQMESIIPPLTILEGANYLIQPQVAAGVLASTCPDCYEPASYIPNSQSQQFVFEPVPGAEPGTYYIHHYGWDNSGDSWYTWSNSGEWVVGLIGGPFNPGDPEAFQLMQEGDGWVRIKHVPTGLFIYQDNIDLRLNSTGDLFRLISDQIEWNVVDRGTVFIQPIMPPAQLDFAYEGNLRNCSAATLEETVGRSETRTRTTTIGTSESLQLFDSVSNSTEISVGVEIKAKVGIQPPVAVGGPYSSKELTISQQSTFSTQTTSSSTSTNSENWSNSTQVSIEVSYIRTVTLPPYTAIVVRDAIKSINNIQVPFTQTLRLRGTDRETGAALTSDELVTQLRFSFFGGVVKFQGEGFVDLTLRGHVVIDQLIHGTTLVDEDVEGCQ